MQSKQGRGLSLALGAAVLVVSVLFVSLGILYRTTTDSAESWYIQIDNDLVTEITPHGGVDNRHPVTAPAWGGGAGRPAEGGAATCGSPRFAGTHRCFGRSAWEHTGNPAGRSPWPPQAP